MPTSNRNCTTIVFNSSNIRGRSRTTKILQGSWRIITNSSTTLLRFSRIYHDLWICGEPSSEPWQCNWGLKCVFISLKAFNYQMPCKYCFRRAVNRVIFWLDLKKLSALCERPNMVVRQTTTTTTPKKKKQKKKKRYKIMQKFHCLLKSYDFCTTQYLPLNVVWWYKYILRMF